MNTDVLPDRHFLTVSQLIHKYDAFSEGSIRWLIYQSKPRKSSKGIIPGNGFNTTLLRIGRRILIDEEKFFLWLEQQSQES